MTRYCRKRNIPEIPFEPGTNNLKDLNGFSIENQKIVSAAPVIWTRT